MCSFSKNVRFRGFSHLEGILKFQEILKGMIEKKKRPVLTNNPLLRFLSDCVHMKLFETQSKDTGQRPPLCCNSLKFLQE